MQVPDTCCTNAPINSPFQQAPATTCSPLNLLANRGVPDVALGIYLNCEAGNVPTWGEFCYPTWTIPTPATCANTCDAITNARSNADTAEQCLQGCQNIIRGEGCYPIRRPVEIGNWFTTGSDPVTGLTYPGFPTINTAPANVATMLTYTNYGFIHLPSCTSTITSGRGDPHLHLAHGGRADFRGEDGGIFNMLSHRNISLNVQTTAADFHWKQRLVHGTKMAAAYWHFRLPSGTTVNVEYAAAEPGHATVTTWNTTHNARKLLLELNAFDRPTKFAMENLAVDLTADKAVKVTFANKWSINAKTAPFPFAKQDEKKHQALLDLTVDTLYDADRDSIAPHGIIGQSYDGDDIGVDGALDSRSGNETTTTAQAEGAIEGHFSDYKMASPFATTFKYTRFDSLAAPHRNVAALRGAKHRHAGKAAVGASDAEA